MSHPMYKHSPLFYVKGILFFAVALFGVVIFLSYNPVSLSGKISYALRARGLSFAKYRRYAKDIDSANCTMKDILEPSRYNYKKGGSSIAAACVPDDYSLFKDLLRDLVGSFSSVGPGFVYSSNFDSSKVISLPLDSKGDYILGARIIVSRNLRNFPFRRSQDNVSLGQSESIIKRGFALASGVVPDCVYSSISSLSDDELLELNNLGLLPNLNPHLEDSLFKILPNIDPKIGASILYNRELGFSALVNGENHLIVTKSVKKGNFRGAFAQVFSFINATKLRFATSDKYGYLASRPEETGSGLTVSFLLKLPKLSKEPAFLRDIASRGNLKIQNLGGDVFLVQNMTKIGLTEVDIVNKTIIQVAEIIRREDIGG